MEATSPSVVPCSGPCRKRFRPDTVNMDTRIADVLLAFPTTADSGLSWFCPECRAGVAAPSPGLLPPEMLVAIFNHLDGYLLPLVRSVCRQWREVVDQNRCLWTKLSTYLKGMSLDRLCTPENLIRGSRVLLDEVKVLGVGSWWSWFAEGLTDLELYSCEVGLPVLVGMLRETPNLTKMILSDVNYSSTEDPVVDFRLEKFVDLKCDEVFDVFSRIFPRLRRLRFQYLLSANEEPKACRLLEAVQDTLQELTCSLTAHILEQMVGMNRLRLTYVDNQSDDQVLAVKLGQIQPSIVNLSVTATYSTLWTLAINLLQLTEIHVRIMESDSVFLPAFLVHAPNLTSFSLAGKDQYPVNFGIVTGQNLKKLSLSSLNLHSPGLSQFLASCTNLQDLQLYSCVLNSWHDLFGVNFRCLHSLKLFWSRTILENCPDLPTFDDPSNSLVTLDIDDCRIPSNLLVQLMDQCFQRLRKVSLRRMDTVNDEVIRHVCLLPQLEDLYLYNCSITDASAAVLSGRTLRQLKIIRREPLVDEEEKLMAFVKIV